MSKCFIHSDFGGMTLYPGATWVRFCSTEALALPVAHRIPPPRRFRKNNKRDMWDSHPSGQGRVAEIDIKSCDYLTATTTHARDVESLDLSIRDFEVSQDLYLDG